MKVGMGISWGAISVINAMPCGIGAVIGTELTTRSEFIPEGRKRTVEITNDPSEPTLLAELCVSAAYAELKIDEPEGWRLKTTSEIPPSRGLKSSSSAANSILSAVFDELGHSVDSMRMIRLGVDCAKRAGVTKTGSFDDACGCHFGGFTITNNTDNEVILMEDFPVYDVILHIPDVKIRKSGLDMDSLAAVADRQRGVIKLSETDPLGALTENGRLIAEASDLDNSVAEDALKAGALAAGITGSGPATAIVTEEGKGKEFVGNTGLKNIIITKTRSLMKQ
ncbi:MAG: shikimate kinase [Candidatus Methanomethylophilaceae archaeon]|jgi:shikimate kinase